ncbi:MAG: hypothetical protein WCC53_16635, partial [Thermoanaerobaculia bacterium]
MRDRVGGRAFLLAATLLFPCVEFGAIAADFYASPTGTTSTAVGTGTISNPWALKTALAQPAAVKPGDT